MERFLNLDDQSTLSEGGMSEEDCGKEKKKRKINTKQRKKTAQTIEEEEEEDGRGRRARGWEGEAR